MSGGQAEGADGTIDLCFELEKRGAHGGGAGWSQWREVGQAWPQEAAVDAIEEDRNPSTSRGEAVAVGLGDSFDEPVKAEAS